MAFIAPDIRAKLAFLNQLKAHYPALFNEATRRHGLQGLAGLGDTATVDTATGPVISTTVGADSGTPAPATDTTNLPWWQSALNSVLTTVQQLAPVYVSSKQAQTCIQVNAARAQQGLSPVDCASSGLAPQVSVGVSPGVQNMGYIALGILAVGVLVMALTKRRR